MKTFVNLPRRAISAAQARILCALGGLVCAVLVSAFIVPHSENVHAISAPQKMWLQVEFTGCGGNGCFLVGYLGSCTAADELAGEKCCDPGANEYVSCLYCGP